MADAPPAASGDDAPPPAASGDDAPALVADLLDRVAAADAAARRHRPGEPGRRQPVHVLYVPADRVTATTARDHGRQARRYLDVHAPDPATLAAAVGVPRNPDLATEVHARVVHKLEAEPVEDLRVDFEDGYLGRSEAEEAADAVATASALAAASADGTAPPFFGLRVKSFADGLAARSVATLERFVGTLVDGLGTVPEGFVVTLPKIVAVDHVAAFAEVLGRLEAAVGVPEGRLRFEAQIETAASVLDPDGRVVLGDLRRAGGGRLAAVHLGVYDYTAGLGLPPAEQRLEHPACDLVRHLMQVTFAGTEVLLSDGSVNAVPGADTRAELHRVWARHGAAVRHSLAHGFVQGWDLHASHLVSRYAVVFAALLDGLGAVVDRLERWYAGAAAGEGGVLDEPATVRRLEAQVRRAIDCHAADRAAIERRLGPLPGSPPASDHRAGSAEGRR